MTVDGHTEEFWIRRSPSLEPHFQQVSFPSGDYEVAFDVDRKDLGFSLKLDDFDVGFDPGTEQASRFVSQVRMTDEAVGIKDEPHTIQMNEPLDASGLHASTSRATSAIAIPRPAPRTGNSSRSSRSRPTRAVDQVLRLHPGRARGLRPVLHAGGALHRRRQARARAGRRQGAGSGPRPTASRREPPSRSCPSRTRPSDRGLDRCSRLRAGRRTNETDRVAHPGHRSPWRYAGGPSGRARPPRRSRRRSASGRPTRSSASCRSCTRAGSSRSTPSPARKSSRSSAARPSSSGAGGEGGGEGQADRRPPSRGGREALRRSRRSARTRGHATWGPLAPLRLVGAAQVLGRSADHPGRIPAAEAPAPGRDAQGRALGDRRPPVHFGRRSRRAEGAGRRSRALRRGIEPVRRAGRALEDGQDDDQGPRGQAG